MAPVLRLGIIGAGLKAAEYARSWAAMPDVAILAAADTSAANLQRFGAACQAAGSAAPAAFGTAAEMLAAMAGQLDAVYIATPHVAHAEGALAVLEAGCDLLLEKPMVTTVPEAKALVEAQARTGRIVVVAFQGGLSPLLHDTRLRARRGDFGDLVSVNAAIWEGWRNAYAGQWKQNPAISGGGFMFDTGAHMMNTVCMLADADFERLSAFTDNRGIAVDVICAVAARMTNGALVTFNAAGEGPPGCASAITFFYTKAIIRIDAWGAWREISMDGKPGARETNEILDSPMQTFQAVRAGRMENPSPVGNGLRFARLWDAIKLSAAGNGAVVGIDHD